MIKKRRKHVLKLFIYHTGLFKIIAFNKVNNLLDEIIKQKEKKIIRKEKERIEKIPRFSPGIFKIETDQIKFIDSASFIFMYNEIFEKEIYRFYSEESEPYIIDCGANIGLSVLYFKKLYKNARIIAFEPDPEVFSVLKENCDLNNLTDVELINKAVWNCDSQLDFFSEGADGGRIAQLFDEKKIIQVQATRLKNFLSVDSVDFLKIDIEGSEYTVILDCMDELKNVQKIFIEYHSFIGQPQDIDRILSILKVSGFRLHINCPGLTSERPFINLNEYADMDMQLNIYGWRQL